MKIIGLTGGSGTGKGTVAARMRSLGAGWVDADAVYRGLCAENRAMLDALDAAFGGVTDENGALDRPKLATSATKSSLCSRRMTRAFRASSSATISRRRPPARASTRSRRTASTAQNAAISSKTTAISIHCTGIPMLYIKFS